MFIEFKLKMFVSRVPRRLYGHKKAEVVHFFTLVQKLEEMQVILIKHELNKTELERQSFLHLSYHSGLRLKEPVYSNRQNDTECATKSN